LGAAIGIYSPLSVAKSFGTLGTVFLALSVLTPLVSTVIIATRHANIPTLIMLVLAPFFLPTVYGWLFELQVWGSAAIIATLALFAAVAIFRKHAVFGVLLACFLLPISYVTYMRPTVDVGIPHQIRHQATLITPPSICAKTALPNTPRSQSCLSTLDQEL